MLSYFPSLLFRNAVVGVIYNETLLKHFRMTKLAVQMLLNEIGLLFGQILYRPIAKSHVFLMRIKEFIR